MLLLDPRTSSKRLNFRRSHLLRLLNVSSSSSFFDLHLCFILLFNSKDKPNTYLGIRWDFQEAVAFCEDYGIALEVIKTEELQDSNYNSNPNNRCFFCKNHLYQAMVDIVQVKYPKHCIINGTNLDDLGDYRPGIEASKLHQVRSPLAELGINKASVIAMADQLGLPNAYKPPSPCLSSRIPYGTAVNAERLAQIEKAEYLLNQYGFPQVRVRYRGSLASIEVPQPQIEQLRAQFIPISFGIRALGFETVEIDGEGFVSGKLNRAIHE